MGAPILDSDDTRPAELAAELELKPVPEKPHPKRTWVGAVLALAAMGVMALAVFFGGADV